MTYLRFMEEDAPSRKTKIVYVEALSTGEQLGVVKWFGRWHQYCFFPELRENFQTIFSKGCLDAINSEISRLMQERKH